MVSQHFCLFREFQGDYVTIEDLLVVQHPVPVGKEDERQNSEDLVGVSLQFIVHRRW
jgi:hypothetical protein